MIARAEPGVAQPFFITSLTNGAARVRPFAYRSPNYTGESLHPAFHIPEVYVPVAGFDKVEPASG